MKSAGAIGAFSLQGPGVNTNNFRVTVFATGLSFPLGMVQLADGSLLVAVSQGLSYFDPGNIGQLLRLTDTNGDGVADDAGTVVYTGLPGALTSVQMCGHLVLVTGFDPGHAIYVLRAGATPASPLTYVGAMTVNYPPGNWEHPKSALAVRPTPGHSGSCDVLFQLGSDQNYAPTTRTCTLSSADIPGATGTLEGQSIYLITLTDNGTNVVASNLTRLAQGLRNPAGIAFHPVTGDLYFEDNGIDGPMNGNEPLSADELNYLPAAQVGNGTVPDFGFPTNYTEYRTGRIVGGGGVQPLFTFQPLPNPFTGSESEGPNGIAFAPAGFPAGLNNGFFAGFHGKGAYAGIANEENPVVYADLTTTNYFQIIGNDEPNIGHLDGLLSTYDSLFLADLTSDGNIYSADGLGNNGVIYQIKSLVAHSLGWQITSQSLGLSWTRGGVLLQATNLAGPWSTNSANTNACSIPINPNQPQSFYRVKY